MTTDDSPPLPPVVSAKRAGEILGVSRQRVHELRQERVLRGVQVEGSGTWIFTRASVEEARPRILARRAKWGPKKET